MSLKAILVILFIINSNIRPFCSPFSVTSGKGVIINVHPNDSSANEKMSLFMALDTSDNSNRYYFSPRFCNETTNECSAPYGYANQMFPHFVKAMNKSLLEQIEGCVEFYDFQEDKGGWVLLFSIDGRPKYCFELEYFGEMGFKAQVRDDEIMN